MAYTSSPFSGNQIPRKTHVLTTTTAYYPDGPTDIYVDASQTNGVSYIYVNSDKVDIVRELTVTVFNSNPSYATTRYPTIRLWSKAQNTYRYYYLKNSHYGTKTSFFLNDSDNYWYWHEHNVDWVKRFDTNRTPSYFDPSILDGLGGQLPADRISGLTSQVDAIVANGVELELNRFIYYHASLTSFYTFFDDGFIQLQAQRSSSSTSTNMRIYNRSGANMSYHFVELGVNADSWYNDSISDNQYKNYGLAWLAPFWLICDNGTSGGVYLIYGITRALARYTICCSPVTTW